MSLCKDTARTRKMSSNQVAKPCARRKISLLYETLCRLKAVTVSIHVCPSGLCTKAFQATPDPWIEREKGKNEERRGESRRGKGAKEGGTVALYTFSPPSAFLTFPSRFHFTPLCSIHLQYTCSSRTECFT